MAFLFSSTTLPAPQNNPLEACPDTPNCVRSSMEFTAEASAAHKAALQVLDKMNAESIVTPSDTEIQAVFKIPIFGFRDDFHVVIEEQAGHQVLVHLRSASRTGHSDLGVNGRRVSRFYGLLTEALN